jgi:hypothetical protein
MGLERTTIAGRTGILPGMSPNPEWAVVFTTRSDLSLLRILLDFSGCCGGVFRLPAMGGGRLGDGLVIRRGL